MHIVRDCLRFDLTFLIPYQVPLQQASRYTLNAPTTEYGLCRVTLRPDAA